jgi:hypothetical protein
VEEDPRGCLAMQLKLWQESSFLPRLPPSYCIAGKLSTHADTKAVHTSMILHGFRQAHTSSISAISRLSRVGSKHRVDIPDQNYFEFSLMLFFNFHSMHHIAL